jgi:hypothetical protein
MNDSRVRIRSRSSDPTTKDRRPQRARWPRRSARRSPPPGRSSDGPAGDRSGETPRQACPKAPRGRVLPGESGLLTYALSALAAAAGLRDPDRMKSASDAAMRIEPPRCSARTRKAAGPTSHSPTALGRLRAAALSPLGPRRGNPAGGPQQRGPKPAEFRPPGRGHFTQHLSCGARDGRSSGRAAGSPRLLDFEEFRTHPVLVGVLQELR